MEWYEALLLLIGSIMFLMAIGMPVALAFLAANIIGAWVFMGGERGVVALLNNGWGALTKFALVPIPLFLLMGEIFFHTGLGGRMFSAIDRLLGRLRQHGYRKPAQQPGGDAPQAARAARPDGAGRQGTKVSTTLILHVPQRSISRRRGRRAAVC